MTARIPTCCFEFGLIVIPQPGSRSRSKTAQDMSGMSGFPARFETFERFGRFFFWINCSKPFKSCAVFERFFYSKPVQKPLKLPILKQDFERNCLKKRLKLL